MKASEEKYADFMLKEYENISQAHFKTNESIASFFRYYLILVAIPFTLLGASGIQEGALGPEIAIVLSIIFLVFSILGLFMMSYVSGQYLDALLYARTVNGIRKYFIGGVKHSDIATESEYIVLPVSIKRPKFRKFGAFYGIIFSFAIMDSSLFITSGYLLMFSQDVDIFPPSFSILSISVIIFAAMCYLHIYCHVANSKNKDKNWNGMQHQSD